MWKDLTLQQKAEIMKMSVANGVTDINDIRALYDGSVGHRFEKAGRIITLADLPREYVQKYGHINVVTPKGVRMPLSQAYRDYNQTPINVNDVPDLTDYLIKQDNPDIQEQAHINKVAADRKVHQLGEERDKALIGLAAAITGGGALASGLALAPVATIGSTIGGIAGEKVFNAGYEKLTGNNWGQDVERWTRGYIPAEYGEYLNPGTLIGGITGDVASKVGRKMLNTAFLSRAMNKSLNLTEIPNSTHPLIPKYRTRLGDVEINDPNLMYHQKANTNTSMFGKSGTGSVLTDKGVAPGNPKSEGQQGYVWFNKGKPYVNTNSEYLVTTPSSNPNLVHVRSQNYPIGQWNGKSGFVLNSEYVSANPVNGTTYKFEPGYGYRKVGTSNPIEIIQNADIQPITEKNALNTTNANWDWNRDIALFRGDQKELQRLRDLHFKTNAPNTKYKGVVYRGMDNNNPYIDMSKMQVSDTKATYVTPHKDYASFYSDKDSNVKSMYVNLENIWRDKLGKEYSFYDPEQLTRLIAKNTSKGNSERAAYFTDIYNSIKDVDGMFRYRTGSALGPADFEAQVPPEILVRNNNALKLTNPITFDDFGNIIPLSKRDNFLSNDIRFANGGHLFDKGGSKNKRKSIRGINYHTNEAQAFVDELVASGVRPVDAQAVAGNVFVESRFNHEASNNINGGHWGLVQNDANIKRHIVKYYGDYSRNSQMQFLKDGLTGQIKGAKNARWLQQRFNDYRKHSAGVKDASIAAKYFHDDYERSKNELVADRMRAASFYQTGTATNPTISAYHKMYGKPDLSIFNDVLYNPAQDLRWQQVPLQNSLQTMQLAQTPMQISMPRIETTPITPIEERVPISDTLPDISPLLLSLPDQQVFTPHRMVTPQYQSVNLNLDSPYLLFRS